MNAADVMVQNHAESLIINRIVARFDKWFYMILSVYNSLVVVQI